MINKNSELSFLLINDCFASPIRSVKKEDKHNYSNTTSLIGGLYDSNNKPLINSLVKRWGIQDIQIHDISYVIDRNIATKIKGRAVYGGVIFIGWGHFILETLARAWYIKDSLDDVYFYCANKKSVNELCGWQRYILSHLIKDTNRIKLITGPTVFEQLIVPDPGAVHGQYLSKVNTDALSSIGKNIIENYEQETPIKKVWLSRTLLTKARVAGEEKFEAALEREGFFIAHPENLPVPEQIKLFENSSVVTGVIGSAFYTVLLANKKGPKIILFSRWGGFAFYDKYSEIVSLDAEFYDFFIKCGEVTNIDSKTARNVMIDFGAVWNVLYNHGYVVNKRYDDPGVEDDLKRLDKECRSRV